MKKKPDFPFLVPFRRLHEENAVILTESLTTLPVTFDVVFGWKSQVIKNT